MEKAIYRKLIDFDFSQSAVLCSLVEWKGSVPRRDYPVMLVLENGKTIGTVGGGAMEFQVIEKARLVLQTGVTTLTTHDMSGSDAGDEAGICGGRTKVLIEKYDPQIQNFWKSINLLEDGKTRNHILSRITGSDNITVQREIIDQEMVLSDLPPLAEKSIVRSREEHKSMSCIIGPDHFLIQWIAPPPRLHLFGAGHVGQAVAELAHFVDLDVIIYDDRQDLATKTRFPFARELNTTTVEKLSAETRIESTDFILIATRGHRHDYELLQWLLNWDYSYLGLMCSEHKWKVLKKGLKKSGFDDLRLAGIHAPVGLDIDSETVPEIAVSIISELIHHYRRGYRAIQSLSNLKEGNDA